MIDYAAALRQRQTGALSGSKLDRIQIDPVSRLLHLFPGPSDLAGEFGVARRVEEAKPLGAADNLPELAQIPWRIGEQEVSTGSTRHLLQRSEIVRRKQLAWSESAVGLTPHDFPGEMVASVRLETRRAAHTAGVEAENGHQLIVFRVREGPRRHFEPEMVGFENQVLGRRAQGEVCGISI